MSTTDQKPLELWGGVECTINRVGDRYFSQLARNGHRTRLSDLDRFAELGLRTLRFPILWEELSDDSLGNWNAIDRQLERMRDLGMRAIAGLVHHGSGPRETSLIDPRFGEKLAAFAEKVAERYPWIDAYTPVNEPLTTARFSGLYGHWFPHGHDGFTFVRALLNQLRGVVLSMRAIRAVNPAASLVQTDDLGKTFASPKLQYQADFENERRWLSWDLLSGRVDREHPMWSYLVWLGANERDIEWFSENPCPPQIIGLNHYVTSERYLDENLRDHAPDTHGGNGRDRYADVAAVRARIEGPAGPEALLREACERYPAPVAVTEAHLGCTREEQLRWLGEVWSAAEKVRSEGGDVCAVTAWSLLGAFDWNSVLTRDDGQYEPGAFDIRDGTPRPTAIAHMIQSLATTGSFSHPVLQTPGWWHRPVRLLPSIAARTRESYPRQETHFHVVPQEAPNIADALLITNPNGPFADAVMRAADLRGLAYVLERGATQPWATVDCGTSFSFSNGLVVRPGKLLAPFTENDATLHALRCLARGAEVHAANDRPISVSFLPDLANAALDLFIDGATGSWRLVHEGVTTEEELLKKLADILRLDSRLVRGVPGWVLGQIEDDSSGETTAHLLPSLDSALHRYCADLPPLTEDFKPAFGAR